MEILNGLKNFFIHLFNATQNIFFGLVAILAYCIGYPAQVAILSAVLIFFVLDIVSKFNAIRIQNKGLYRAFLNKKLTSRGFWNGFITKVVAYFIVLTAANLAIVTPQISFMGKAFGTVCYLGLFFYEFYSNLENLRDAGWLGANPLMKYIKKQQDKLFEIDESSTPEISTETENMDSGEAKG